MKLIYNPSNIPAFNLAMEEVLLKTSTEDVVMLWRNSPAVIIGRNQNAHAEIDFTYVQDNHIAVIRRLTGGGAVFHDLGNLNFTLISAYEEGRFNDYKYFTQPIIDYLAWLGIKAEQTGRNDLTIGGNKFSGNAQTVYKGRILHHGTILFDADLSRLALALKPNKEKMESKGIQSVISRVTNVKSHLEIEMNIEQFERGLYDFFNKGQDVAAHSLTEQQIADANKLVANKYDHWNWNFGNSPAFECTKSGRFSGGSVQVSFGVKAGLITGVQFFGDFFGIYDIKQLEMQLVGVEHNPDVLKNKLAEVGHEQYISRISADELTSLFF